jgi:hypothetical protein
MICGFVVPYSSSSEDGLTAAEILTLSPSASAVEKLEAPIVLTLFAR